MWGGGGGGGLPLTVDGYKYGSLTVNGKYIWNGDFREQLRHPICRCNCSDGVYEELIID